MYWQADTRKSGTARGNPADIIDRSSCLGLQGPADCFGQILHEWRFHYIFLKAEDDTGRE